MELRDYPRPDRDNGRGMHWSASPYHPTELDEWMARLKAMNIRWLKVIDDGGGSSVRLCAACSPRASCPLFASTGWSPTPATSVARKSRRIRDLVKLGVRYIETNNEPDLQVEWSTPPARLAGPW